MKYPQCLAIMHILWLGLLSRLEQAHLQRHLLLKADLPLLQYASPLEIQRRLSDLNLIFNPHG